MASILRNVLQTARAFITQSTGITAFCRQTTSPAISSVIHRFYSRDPYDPYPTYDTPSPYRSRYPYNRSHKVQLFTGGVLPRSDKFKDKPLPRPLYRAHKQNNWTKKKALFGQNDYIDILGDGSIQPGHLLKGPLWIQGFKGNELQRLVQRSKFQGSFMRDNYPKKHFEMRKRMFFLYKKLNKRKSSGYWGSRTKSRIDSPRH